MQPSEPQPTRCETPAGAPAHCNDRDAAQEAGGVRFSWSWRRRIWFARDGAQVVAAAEWELPPLPWTIEAIPGPTLDGHITLHGARLHLGALQWNRAAEHEPPAWGLPLRLQLTRGRPLPVTVCQSEARKLYGRIVIGNAPLRLLYWQGGGRALCVARDVLRIDAETLRVV